MSTRSVVLAAGSVTGRVFAVVYTCPTGTHAILKSAQLLFIASASSDVILEAGRPGVGGIYLINEASVAAYKPVLWDGWIVLEPGDTLAMTFSVGPWHYRLSGATLPVP